MPKSRKVVKKEGRIFKSNVATKFLIGTRKGGVSANLMSNEALQKVLDNKDQAKYHSSARAVLDNRL